MRYNIAMKIFFYILIIVMLIIFFYISLTDLKNTNSILISAKRRMVDSMEKLIIKLSDENVFSGIELRFEMKYILLWTSSKDVPFLFMSEGQNIFIENNCRFINCFVTHNKSYLGDYTKFDVIIFAGRDVDRISNLVLPDKRSVHQKYVFASMESSDYYPVCSDKLDNFFNWTWTYKLNSDSRWGYIVIRDSDNNIIGPNEEMHWIKLEDMDPVTNEFKEKLKMKTKTAAWFVSDCYSRSGREIFVRELNLELVKHNLKVDIYGHCGTLKCPPEGQDACLKMLESDYYFYLSFENSFAEDFVTEKLLYPLVNNVVPIVFGGANYTRFMPDGIYLNARELGAAKLADKINELISNPDLYAEYFRWKNHYSYHSRSESIETDDYCRFCSMLNNEDLVQDISTYPNFRQWWDPPNRC